MGAQYKGPLPKDSRCYPFPKKNITIERSEENGPINHVQISCEVNRDSFTAVDSYEIKFTVKCKYRNRERYYNCGLVARPS